MEDEGGSPLRLLASFVAAIVVLAVMVLFVSQPGLLRSKHDSGHVARVVPTPVDFPLPPLPPPDVTVYYLVDTSAQAATLRAKSQEEDALRRASGQPPLARVQPLIGYTPERVAALRADIATQQQLQNFFGVKYEIVDLRGQ